MKILHLSPFFSPNIGGVETHLDDLLAELDNNNIETVMLTFQPLMLKVKAPNFEKRGSAIYIRRYEWFRNLFYIVEPHPILDFLYLTPYLFLRAFTYMLLNGKSIDCIHAHGFNAAFAGKVLKAIFKKPLVISTHATYDLEKNAGLAKKVAFVMQSADAILTLSKLSKSELVSIGLDENKIFVYKYWVDQEIFKPVDKQTSKNNLNFDLEKFNLLFVGRVIEKKGIKELVQAADSLKNLNIDIYIAGSGDLNEFVSDAAKSKTNVKFLGKINNKDLPKYYNAADAVIVPSTHDEGFGRVILEALSCGTPVLGSDRGGIKEAMSSEVGVLFDVNAENISNACKEIMKRLKNDGLEHVRTTCRNFATAHYSKQNINLFIETYEKLKAGNQK